VCSTSLPQHSIPLVIGDSRYTGHLQHRKGVFEARVNEAWAVLSKVKGVHVNKPQGAFYMTVLFEDGVLNDRQTLPIEDKTLREYVESMVKTVKPDKRFVYYLLAATGICVVPLTGFCCKKHGFRVTLLETNDQRRRWTWETIAESIRRYLES
ncbi:MAG TPA: hypothetical protein VLH60_07065, partial [Sedimentisphaerales bacterium]|nr:hypothetical protein [Sedimentisphaerales bacterium]